MTRLYKLKRKLKPGINADLFMIGMLAFAMSTGASSLIALIYLYINGLP